MNLESSPITCFVVGSDPIVRMDIQETLLRHFPHWTVVVLAQIDHLEEIAERAEGKRLFITASDPVAFAEKAKVIDISDPAYGIVVSGRTHEEVPSRIPYQILPKPFGMGELLNAVEIALLSLQSSPK